MNFYINIYTYISIYIYTGIIVLFTSEMETTLSNPNYNIPIQLVGNFLFPYEWYNFLISSKMCKRSLKSKYLTKIQATSAILYRCSFLVDRTNINRFVKCHLRSYNIFIKYFVNQLTPCKKCRKKLWKTYIFPAIVDNMILLRNILNSLTINCTEFIAYLSMIDKINNNFNISISNCGFIHPSKNIKLYPRELKSFRKILTNYIQLILLEIFGDFGIKKILIRYRRNKHGIYLEFN